MKSKSLLVAGALLAWCVNSAGCSGDEPMDMGTPASGGSAAPSAPGSGGVGAASHAGSSGASTGGAGASPAGTGGRSGSAASGGSPAAAGAGGTGAGGTGGVGTGGMPGADAGAAPCEKGSVSAAEVVFIGESFIAQTGAIPRLVTQLARDAGTIGMSESYRSFAVSGTQLTTDEIPMQFDRAKAESPVKVVLMDGGGNDLLFGGYCTDGPASCEKVVMVVDTLFAQMGKDGVKDVLYFFYPDPMGIGADIKDAMDVLRPEMKALCDATTDVRCVWVDQRESWEGHYDAFTSDGIHPTEEGATASAGQIWDAMVANCIAQ